MKVCWLGRREYLTGKDVRVFGGGEGRGELVEKVGGTECECVNERVEVYGMCMVWRVEVWSGMTLGDYKRKRKSGWET